MSGQVVRLDQMASFRNQFDERERQKVIDSRPRPFLNETNDWGFRLYQAEKVEKQKKAEQEEQERERQRTADAEAARQTAQRRFDVTLSLLFDQWDTTPVQRQRVKTLVATNHPARVRDIKIYEALLLKMKSLGI